MKKLSESYKENRKNLIDLSKTAKILVQEGECSTVNEALIEIYKETHPEIKEFNTFNNWKKLGKMIKKGAKAFLVWGQPVKGKGKQEETTTPNSAEISEDDYKYYPLAYLFADTQVLEVE